MGKVIACVLLVALAGWLTLVGPGRRPGLRRNRRRLMAVGRARVSSSGSSGFGLRWGSDPRGLSTACLTADDVAALADQVAALAAAGLPPHRIWSAIADHGPSPAVCAAAMSVVASHNQGLGPAEALRVHLASRPAPRWIFAWRGRHSGQAHRDHDPAAVHLTIALEVSERTGAGEALTLRRFAEGLRADERAAQERAAALAGPQATASVLAVLPLAGLLLGAVVGGRPWHALVATAPGRGCLVLGGTLWAIGRWWTRYLVRCAAGPR
jgi:tight adherence protein B